MPRPPAALRGIPSELNSHIQILQKPLVDNCTPLVELQPGPHSGDELLPGFCVLIDGEHLLNLPDVSSSVVNKRPAQPSKLWDAHASTASLQTDARVSFAWLKGKQGAAEYVGADLNSSSLALHWVEELQAVFPEYVSVAFAPAAQRIYPQDFPREHFKKRGHFRHFSHFEDFSEPFGALVWG